MEKDRHSRILPIIALFVSVLTITLGFAAFSNSLTISSSATVTPDEKDFNINVYGIDNWGEIGGYPPLSLYTSTTTSVPLRGINNSPAAISGTPAKITDDGKSITITDINIELSEPGQTASYFFMIKNEGKYDAYLDLTNIEDFSLAYPVEGTCTPAEGTSIELVEKTCPYITITSILSASDGWGYSGGEYAELKKGDYLLLEMVVDYYSAKNIPRADGEFTITFPDKVFNFTTVPPKE